MKRVAVLLLTLIATSCKPVVYVVTVPQPPASNSLLPRNAGWSFSQHEPNCASRYTYTSCAVFHLGEECNYMCNCKVSISITDLQDVDTLKFTDTPHKIELN